MKEIDLEWLEDRFVSLGGSAVAETTLRPRKLSRRFWLLPAPESYIQPYVNPKPSSRIVYLEDLKGSGFRV